MAGIDVSVDAVHKMGKDITNLTDEVHAALSRLSGTSKVVSNYTTGFECSDALADCERAWEQATDTLLVKLATTGQDMVTSADEYLRRDDEAAQLMPK